MFAKPAVPGNILEKLSVRVFRSLVPRAQTLHTPQLQKVMQGDASSGLDELEAHLLGQDGSCCDRKDCLSELDSHCHTIGNGTAPPLL